MNLQKLIQQKKSLPYYKILDSALARHIQNILIWHKLLESNADGKWGRISTYALVRFQKIHSISETLLGLETAKALFNTHPDRTQALMASVSQNFLSRVVACMRKKGFKVFTQPGEINIVYVEGVDPNFNLNADTPNVFNDLAIIFDFVNNAPRLLGKWVATADPGRYYTDSPMNPKGALHHNGQATAWRVGKHKDHRALVQCDYIEVTRDYNKDFRTEGDKKSRGKYFGANCHGSRTNNIKDIGRWSAGCKVVWGMRQHQEFMAVVESDRRYRQNPNFVFTVATLEGTELLTVSSTEAVSTPKIGQEIELLAKTIWGEARGESKAGKIATAQRLSFAETTKWRCAIAHTALNRLKISQATAYDDWWGNTLEEILLQPYQFSCHNPGDPNKAFFAKLTTGDPQFRECLEIARGVMNGSIPDNTGGASHYFNFNVVLPEWSKEMEKTARIGNHDFYK